MYYNVIDMDFIIFALFSIILKMLINSIHSCNICFTMLIVLILISAVLKISTSLNIVIWNKDKQDFIPIFNISTYQSFRSITLNSSRELETHNFHKQPVAIAFFQVSKCCV